MKRNLNHIDLFKGRADMLVNGLHGLERESLRVDQEGNLSLKPHPVALGDKLTDPAITTDFSESQIELITPPYSTIEATITSLEKLHRLVYENLGDEVLWPMSMPAKLPSEEKIPIAYYGTSPEAQEKEIYRRGLALRYGKYMQMISGVHYNMSFSKEFWELMYAQFGKEAEPLQDFINESYLHIVRNFIRLRWFLIYFFGASPYKDESYRCKLMTKEKDKTISLRSSRCGYSNPTKIPITYNNFKQHLADLQFAVQTPHSPYTELGIFRDGQQVQLNDHILQIGNEYYSPIRLKPPKPYRDMVEALAKDGVNYIEIRVFDTNPFAFSGVTEEQLYISHLFLLYCFFLPSPFIEEKDLEEGTTNQLAVAIQGRDLNLKLQRNGVSTDFKGWTQEILQEMEQIVALLRSSSRGLKYQKALTYLHDAFQNPQNFLPSFRIAKEMKEQNLSFIEYGLVLAKKNAQLGKE